MFATSLLHYTLRTSVNFLRETRDGHDYRTQYSRSRVRDERVQ